MALSGSFHEYPVGEFGLYCEWSGIQNIAENYTDITLNVYLRYYRLSVSSRNDSTISINGSSETYTAPSIDDTTSTAWKNRLLKSKTVRVSHNSDGTKKNVELKASWRFLGTYSGVYVDTITAETTVELDTIDRSAPTVSCTADVISSTSFSLSASASEICDLWEYSIDGGSTWIQFSTTLGINASKTLTTLTSRVYSVKVRARKKTNQIKGISSAVSVDIIAPSVSFTSSNITANSFSIDVSASATCDLWEYSLDGGSTWIQFSTSAKTTASKNFTGLSPNTTYSLKVRARKKSNGLYGTSVMSAIKTLGGSLLNSVSTVTADDEEVIISLNWTVYDSSHTHSLAIKNGDTTILTITGLSGSKGTNNKTCTLTSSKRNTLLNAMSDITSFKATFVLTTYSGSSQVGSPSDKKATVKTTYSNSAPIFQGFTFRDSNSTTVNVTDNDQIFIQNYSELSVECSTAIAKNGASIVKYTATVGSYASDSTTTSINFGNISVFGTMELNVRVTDSRGYTRSFTKNITVIEYKKISINEWWMRRVNEVEETTQLFFKGKFSTVSIGNESKNSVQSAKYRYKKSDQTSWSSWRTINNVNIGTSSYNYENLAFTLFDQAASFNIQLRVSDKLTNSTVNIFLNKGTPLVAFRAQKVGINKVDPQAALDVEGGALIDGGIAYHSKNLIIEAGKVTITPTAANTPTSTHITFTKQFTRTPIVLASGNTQTPGVYLIGVGTANASTTGFDIFINRTNTADTPVSWVAIQIN